MTVLHGWAIFLGAMAVGLPLVVHWLSRPRPRRRPLSTLRFVVEVVQQKRAVHRLRDVIILCLRVLAVMLLAWAFARPLMGAGRLVSADAKGDATRVVVVDCSQSMGAISNGVAAFARAKPVAIRYLEGRPGLRSNLILAGARARGVFEQPSSNPGALREDLAAAQVRPERLDVQAAINAAGGMLAQSAPGQRRELVIVSDFQRANWVGADFSGIPRDAVVQLESVAPRQTPANLAVLRVGVQGRAEQGRTVRLEADVGNYSGAGREVQLEASVGVNSYRFGGMCPPSAKTTLSTEIVLPTAGWQMGAVSLVGVSDSLKADDTRACAVEVRPVPTYALLTREPASPRPLSSHYLERALAPLGGREGQAGERVIRLDPLKLDRSALAAADLLVLDHPGPLPAEQAGLLAAMLRRGRGMLYVTAEPVDAKNLRLLAEAAGSDLKMPVEFAPAAAGQVRQGLFWAELRRESPPLASFGPDVISAMGSLRFGGGLLSRALPGGLVDDVRATYSDRTAGLVVTTCGAGMLAVLNADLTASDLPSSPLFVPLVGELTGHLLTQRRADSAAACGESAAQYLPTEAGTVAGLKVEAPEGVAAADADLGTIAEDGGFVIWRWNAAGGPGVYQIRRDGKTVFALATAIAPQESDLQALDEAVLKERLAGGLRVAFRNAAGGDGSQQEKDDAWAWVLAVCAACVLAEWAALKAFRT